MTQSQNLVVSVLTINAVWWYELGVSDVWRYERTVSSVCSQLTVNTFSLEHTLLTADDMMICVIIWYVVYDDTSEELVTYEWRRWVNTFSLEQDSRAGSWVRRLWRRKRDSRCSSCPNSSGRVWISLYVTSNARKPTSRSTHHIISHSTYITSHSTCIKLHSIHHITQYLHLHHTVPVSHYKVPASYHSSS